MSGVKICFITTPETRRDTPETGQVVHTVGEGLHIN